MVRVDPNRSNTKCGATRERLRRGPASGRDVDDYLEALRVVFGVLGVTVAAGHSWAGWTRDLGVPAGWQHAYERFVPQDPSQEILHASALGSWFIASEVLDPDSDGGMFAAAIACGVGDTAITRLATLEGGYLTMVLLRSVDAPRFSAADRDTLELWHPFISAAFGTHLALAALCLPPAHSLADLRLSCAVAVVDLEADTLDWDRRGASSLDVWFELGSARARQRLEGAILRVARLASPANLRSRSRSLQGEHLHVEIVVDDGGRRLAVVFDKRSLESPPHAALWIGSPLSELLSERQYEIAEFASHGASTEDIAAQLELGVETVRHHLRGIYRRLGINSRGQLARFFAAHEP